MTYLNPSPRHVSPRRVKTRVVAFLAFLVVLGSGGIGLRLMAAHSLDKSTQQQSLLSVRTSKPITPKATQDLVLPGNIQAFIDAPIYARTSGYLKNWLVDIGMPVKAGQLMAEIESPEVDQQLAQGEANLAQARTNLDLAEVTATRWRNLLKTKSLSQQEADEKASDANAKRAALKSEQANVARLRQLQEFELVKAPFDGVVTQRNTDVGALINAGNTNGQQLFRIAAMDKLRVYVQVPETYAQYMNASVKTELNVAEHPGENFPAKLVSTSNAIDPVSRTLNVQLEIDNSKKELFAGAYVEVHFSLTGNPNALHVPVSALLFRAQGMQVATVGADNHVVLKPITIGRDYGSEVEVASGLTPDDQIVINVSDSIANGQEVKISPPPQDNTPASTQR